ncbi:MAG: hypothetical protein DRH50_13110 [Deltaproteobacteria bacterium]|nr:MAG: hypothetical protein DRH50_13110 [Deltaproteobacteria bacterium]
MVVASSTLTSAKDGLDIAVHLKMPRSRHSTFAGPRLQEAGLAKSKGSVLKGETPRVSYHLSMFQKDGKVTLPAINFRRLKLLDRLGRDNIREMTGNAY